MLAGFFSALAIRSGWFGASQGLEVATVGGREVGDSCGC